MVLRAGLLRGLMAAVTLLHYASQAAGQLYRDELPDDYVRRVSTRKATTAAIPQVVVQGDYALSGWSSDLVYTPGVSVLRLSTGEALWKELADPGDTLTAWLRGSTVLIERGGATTAGRVCEWRDLETGALRTSVSVTADSGLAVSLLQTVVIVLPRDVYDLEFGEYLGRLPDEFDLQTHEFNGRIYAFGITPPGVEDRELIAADLSDLTAVRRWSLKPILPEGMAWSFQPILSDGRRIVFAGSSSAWSGISFARELIAPRALIAMDLERGELAWQRDVPGHAPLYFVAGSEKSPDDERFLRNSAVRPLMIEWATGRLVQEAAPVASTDKMAWITGAFQLVRMRQMGELTVLHFVSGDQEQLVGLDATGLPVWHRGLRSMSALQDQAVAGFTVRMPETGPLAVALAGGSFEVLDLHTGETVRHIRPEALGFNRRRAVSRAASAGTSPAATPKRSAADPARSWIDIRESLWLVVLMLLVGYLAVRIVANLSESKSPRPRG